MIKIGDVIDDRYRISEFIGSGGMAEVYVANDFIADRFVVIKLLKEEFLNDETIKKSFKDEIIISSSMNHPNIIQVYNEGVFHNRPYIIFEYFKDQTLRNKLDYLTKFSVSESIQIMLQLLDATEYTHNHGLIHRDIKTQNIFYLSNGTIKLGDFGIAINKENMGDKILGSVYYLAPEVLNGFPYSIRSDIYALGITFFELLTGRLPFENGSAKEIADCHKNKKIPLPSKLVTGIPKEIDAIIIKSTNKKPQDRYLSIKEFRNDIQSYLDGIYKKETILNKLLKKI